MKTNEFRQKTKEELTKLLFTKRNEYLNLRFDLAGGRVKNIKGIRSARKDIARILTLLNNANA
jgi:large subunit ribosomal protein L29